ncbi:hypothetical protein IWW56_001664 [Coemansia sp. RSA 2131]|nr:hypothetical protein IWW56_001664 [Coemansia sp. RSA 2131]
MRCDNQNTLDAYGNIVDRRAEMYCESPIPRRQQLPEPSTPVNTPHVFCPTCQRNQELVCQILSAYLPDESDPEYQNQYECADEYAESLKRRYPVVCRSCQVKVDRKLQMQAQWMYRRELASALHRSESVRKFAPSIRPQPTLRRKRLVATWVVCALVALVACPLAAWGMYMCLLRGYFVANILSAGAALALSLVTYVSRMLNPLWLYIASNPGLRAAGLPLYKQRVAYISLLRFISAILQVTTCHSGIWAGILVCDIVLCVWAMSCLRTHNSRRPASRINRSIATRDNDVNAVAQAPAVVTERDTQQTLMSLKSLSFGASESNMDQDDSAFGSAFSTATNNPWQRRPSAAVRTSQRRTLRADSSDEDVAATSDILSDLNTLSFGTRAQNAPRASLNNEDDELSALFGGSSNIGNSGIQNRNSMLGRAQSRAKFGAPAQEPRPFEAFAFNRNIDTGLESKMSSFSIDDGSYQGLFGSSAMDIRLITIIQRLVSPGFVVGSCVVASWIAGSHMPLLAFWIVRLALFGVAAASVASISRVSGVARVYGSAVLLALVCLPVWITLQSPQSTDSELYSPASYVDSFVSEPRLVHWPLAKQQLSFGFNRPVPDANDHDDVDLDDDWNPQIVSSKIPPAVPYLPWIDCTVELSALALLAFA